MLKRSPLSKVLAPRKTLQLNDTQLFKSTQNSLVPHQIDSSNFEKLYHRWSKFPPKTRCRAVVNCFDKSPKRELEMFLLLYFDFNSVNSFSDFFVFRIVASVETSEKWLKLRLWETIGKDHISLPPSFSPFSQTLPLSLSLTPTPTQYLSHSLPALMSVPLSLSLTLTHTNTHPHTHIQ